MRHTPGSGDGGIDLFVEHDAAVLGVQCKRWKGDIGSPVVRDFFGSLIHADATHGFIITTAKFSQSAKAFAHGKQVTLIDGSLLLQWIDGRHTPRVAGYSVRAPRHRDHLFHAIVITHSTAS